MTTKIALGFIMMLCLAMAGCGLNKDAEVDAFMNDLETTTKEMAAKIDANPTSAGVDEAQKVLDGKKDSLKKTFNELKNATGYVSQEAQKKLTDGMTRTQKVLSEMATKHTASMVKEPAFGTKLQKLMLDYSAILQ